MILKYWTKHEKSRAAYVSLDDELWGVLPLRTLRHLYPLGAQAELDEAGVNELKELLEKRVWQLLTEYLAKAEHSEHQCRSYLKRKDFHHTIIEKAISIALEKRFIDDARFSEILVRSLVERGKSRRYITQKLYEQRIPEALYQPFLEEYLSADTLKENLDAQMAKLLIRYRTEPPAKQKEKIFASLYRKGFELEDIAAAFSRALRA